MDGSSRRARTLLGAVATALTLAGPVMLLRGSSGRREIRAEATAQKITFPEHRLPEPFRPVPRPVFPPAPDTS
ncbi:hypothetical protein [Streptomyces sp. YIM S03343]